MPDLPKTIYNPEGFLSSPTAGFDGVFDWDLIFNDCFGNTKITPTDIDCIIERKGRFIVCETKLQGVKIPLGQEILLKELHKLGVFTIYAIWGKAGGFQKAWVRNSIEYGGEGFWVKENVGEVLNTHTKEWFNKTDNLNKSFTT
jgi:hypothetical protein